MCLRSACVHLTNEQHSSDADRVIIIAVIVCFKFYYFLFHMQIDKVVRGAAVIFSDLQSANFRRCELLSSDALVAFCQKSCRNLQVGADHLEALIFCIARAGNNEMRQHSDSVMLLLFSMQ